MLENTIKDSVGMIKSKAGENGKVIVLVSGGVDSMVTAALLLKALPPENVYAIYVDHGFMRKNESDFVCAQIGKLGFEKQNFLRVNAHDKFMPALAGVTEPEAKREIIGGLFIEVVKESADTFDLDYDTTFIAQGTLKPDLIESANPDLVKDKSEKIKTHHNDVDIIRQARAKGLIIETNWNWYKEDVRQVARMLGIDGEIAGRQPFPGPGLAVRCLGELTKARLDRLREADAIFTEEIKKAGLQDKIHQYFAVLTGIRSVGIRNGRRCYEEMIALRAMTTKDFMTAEAYRLPYDLLEVVMKRITGEVAGVNRVVYDLTDKPPATMEWE
jgi:GMP synthase (glutamine-hydrolysing)